MGGVADTDMMLILFFYKSLCQEKGSKNKEISNYSYEIILKHRPLFLFHKLERILSDNKNIEYSQMIN